MPSLLPSLQSPEVAIGQDIGVRLDMRLQAVPFWGENKGGIPVLKNSPALRFRENLHRHSTHTQTKHCQPESVFKSGLGS